MDGSVTIEEKGASDAGVFTDNRIDRRGGNSLGLFGNLVFLGISPWPSTPHMQPLNGQSPDWQILCWATESAQLVWDRKPERRFLPIASQPPTMISPTTGCALWVFVCQVPTTLLSCACLYGHMHFNPMTATWLTGSGFPFQRCMISPHEI
ncbi:hypothetical protein QC762_102248 [Podospora pseudocomata]|uniref:Uncharacterized protein n=1 Tax=Podospora pseudocomata TaxID=2093779 RepID=A0ABR0GRY4_9PEZI|nr:hypothetical protein QC762_102248 [Podospora pseudocomata]